MNIILYVIDALRADHLSCYGYRRETTPHLDRLAKQALLFENAFAVSTWTRSAAGSLLTSTYPSVHGAIHSGTPFAPRSKTLPEILRDEGFDTLGVSTIANVSSSLGFGRGFQTFVDLYKEPWLAAKREVLEVNRYKGAIPESHRFVIPLAEDVNEYLFPWLEAHRGRPFFLFAWVIDPHNPYSPPMGFQPFLDPSYKGSADGSLASIQRARSPRGGVHRADIARLVDLYDCEIYYADHCFGQLRAKLESLGLWDEALVVVTGDHGEAFNEHGHMLHAHIPYDELLRVPLLIKRPEGWANTRFAPTGRVGELVTSLDIMPTILDSLALQQDGQQGRSLLPLLGAPGAIHDYVFSECQPSESGPTFSSIRSPEWKFILVEPPQGKRSLLRAVRKLLSNAQLLREVLANPLFYWKRRTGLQRELLFHLSEDPGERVNVGAIGSRRYPDVAAALKGELLAWRARNQQLALQGPASEDKYTVDEDTLKQLKGLGYL